MHDGKAKTVVVAERGNRQLTRHRLGHFAINGEVINQWTETPFGSKRLNLIACQHELEQQDIDDVLHCWRKFHEIERFPFATPEWLDETERRIRERCDPHALFALE